MLIYGDKVFLPEKGFISAYIITEGGKIVSISEKCDKTPDISAHYVFPGFIDIHTHGAMGGDTIDCDYNALVEMKKYMANHGTTAFMPTALSATIDTIVSSIENAKKVKNTVSDGADIAGMYIEGPYFTEKFKGAHLAHFLKAPSNEELDRMIDAGEGLVRIICLAPEYENAKEFIEYATSKGLVVSIAHTAAKFEEVMAAIDAGATNITHLYNAMSPFTHREPGTVGAAFASDTTAEIICDGFHVHPAAAKIAIKQKGYKNMALISDSLAPAGLPDGNYKLGDQDVIVKGGKATIPAGNLAGSTTNILQCFKNVIKWGIPIEEAAVMASEVPARAAGLKTKGKISESFDADFTILNDDLSLSKTIVSGEIKYEA